MNLPYRQYDFEDVQLGEQRRKLLGRRRRPAGAGLGVIGIADGVGLQAARQQAGRAEPSQDAGRKRLGALRT